MVLHALEDDHAAVRAFDLGCLNVEQMPDAQFLDLVLDQLLDRLLERLLHLADADHIGALHHAALDDPLGEEPRFARTTPTVRSDVAGALALKDRCRPARRLDVQLH